MLQIYYVLREGVKLGSFPRHVADHLETDPEFSHAGLILFPARLTDLDSIPCRKHPVCSDGKERCSFQIRAQY